MSLKSVLEEKERFLLMNKDVILASFIIHRNNHDNIEIEKYYNELPSWITSIEEFLKRRKAPNSRAYIVKLFMQAKIRSLYDYLVATKSLGLNDTLWVKRDGEKVFWKDVSLYRNDFSELIASTAFNGVLSNSMEFSSLSPEFSTGGNAAKCWRRQGQDTYLYKWKVDEDDRVNMGVFSEWLSQQVIHEFGVPYALYELEMYHDKLCSKSKNFTTERLGFLPIGRVLRKGIDKDNIAEISNKFRLSDEIRKMIVADFLILNVDRHYGNFGFLFDNDTYQIKEFAPVFDQNRCLFFRYKNLISVEDCLEEVQYTDTFLGGVYSYSLAKNIMTDDIKSIVNQLTKFEFMNHTKFPMDQKRLDILSAFVRGQARRLTSVS